MRVLITNNHLDSLGGSETFTYTLVKAAMEYGFSVEIMTRHPGIVSQKIIDDFGVSFRKSSCFDLILANHNTMVQDCSNIGLGPIIQTCHGIFPKLEQPSPYASAFVAISEEVLRYLEKFNYPLIPSVVIRNMIDTDRFKIDRPVNKYLGKIYSLSQNDHFNALLKDGFSKYGISFNCNNKFTNSIWHTEKMINDADMVVSLGRGAMEAMSCGRQVIVSDHRPYQDQISDGIISYSNVDALSSYNFSGRMTRQKSSIAEIVEQSIVNYNSDESLLLREWVIVNLDYRLQFQKYLNLWHQIK